MRRGALYNFSAEAGARLDRPLDLDRDPPPHCTASERAAGHFKGDHDVKHIALARSRSTPSFRACASRWTNSWTSSAIGTLGGRARRYKSRGPLPRTERCFAGRHVPLLVDGGARGGPLRESRAGLSASSEGGRSRPRGPPAVLKHRTAALRPADQQRTPGTS